MKKNSFYLLLLLFTSYGLYANTINDPIKYQQGATQFHLACKKGNTHLMLELIDQGANMHQLDDWSWNGMHFAARHNKIEAVKILFQLSINAQQQDICNKTPFYYACLNNHQEIIQYFIEKNCIDHGYKNHKDWIALQTTFKEDPELQQTYNNPDNSLYKIGRCNFAELQFYLLLTKDFEMDILHVIFSKPYYKNNAQHQIDALRLAQIIAAQDNNPAISIKSLEQASLIIEDKSIDYFAGHPIYFFHQTDPKKSYHECGHALLGLYLHNGFSFGYISLQPAQSTGGRFQSLQTSSQLSLEELKHRIMIFCGGYIGELIYDFLDTNELDNGHISFIKFQSHFSCRGDYKKACQLACQYLEIENQNLYENDQNDLEDAKIELVKQCYIQALTFLTQHISDLAIIAEKLHATKFLTANQIKRLLPHIQFS